jgi:hypothetical protein
MSYMSIPNYMKPVLSGMGSIYNMGQVMPPMMSVPFGYGGGWGSVGKHLIPPMMAGVVPAVAYKGLKGMTTGKRGKVWKPSTHSNVNIGVSKAQRANMAKRHQSVLTEAAVHRMRANPHQIRDMVRRNVYGGKKKKRYRKRKNYY